MGLVAEFEITCEQLPLVAVASGVSTATIDVEMVPTEGGRTPFVAHVDQESCAAVECAFESVAFVGEYTVIGETEKRRRYKIQPGVSLEGQLGGAVEDLDGLRALANTESIIDRIRITPTGWIQSGWFADRGAFDEFRTFWQADGNGDGFTLHRLTRSDDGPRSADGESTDGLTTPQRDAVRTAHEMGYFDIPRTTSLDEVADELGISAPSCSERLRRAQDHLVEAHVLEDAPRRGQAPAESLT